MAGDSNTGGGGSVHWKVDASKVQQTDTSSTHTGTGKGWHTQKGRDQDGDIGDFFTVSIKVPNGRTPEEFLAKFQWAVDGDRVYFNLQIEDDPEQVRVSWGDNPNHRGIGGKAGRPRA